MSGIPNADNAPLSLRQEIGASIPSTGFKQEPPQRSPAPTGTREVPFSAPDTTRAVEAHDSVKQPDPFKR